MSFMQWYSPCEPLYNQSIIFKIDLTEFFPGILIEVCCSLFVGRHIKTSNTRVASFRDCEDPLFVSWIDNREGIAYSIFQSSIFYFPNFQLIRYISINSRAP